MRQEIRAIGRQLEERLVQQVDVQIAAPDVGDERSLRARRENVREVLIRTDTEIHAARPDRGRQLGNDRLEPVLVRNEIVGVEIAVGLGEPLDELPELRVREIAQADCRACAGAVWSQASCRRT